MEVTNFIIAADIKNESISFYIEGEEVDYFLDSFLVNRTGWYKTCPFTFISSNEEFEESFVAEVLPEIWEDNENVYCLKHINLNNAFIYSFPKKYLNVPISITLDSHIEELEDKISHIIEHTGMFKLTHTPVRQYFVEELSTTCSSFYF